MPLARLSGGPFAPGRTVAPGGRCVAVSPSSETAQTITRDRTGRGRASLGVCSRATRPFGEARADVRAQPRQHLPGAGWGSGTLWV